MSVKEYLELMDKHGINMIYLPSSKDLENVTIEEAEKGLSKINEIFNKTFKK